MERGRTESLEADVPRIGEHDEPDAGGHQRVVDQNEHDDARQRFAGAAHEMVSVVAATKPEQSDSTREIMSS